MGDINDAEFEHLQDRVDNLENLLSDLVIFGKGKTITRKELKDRLIDAGILNNKEGD